MIVTMRYLELEPAGWTSMAPSGMDRRTRSPTLGERLHEHLGIRVVQIETLSQRGFFRVVVLEGTLLSGEA